MAHESDEARDASVLRWAFSDPVDDDGDGAHAAPRGISSAVQRAHRAYQSASSHHRERGNGVSESRHESDLSLPQFLSTRARHATDARLALDVACGFVIALVAVLWRGPAWHIIASAAVCFLAYGGWGIVDRELAERAMKSDDRHAGLRAGRTAAAAVGAIAGVSLVVSGLFFLLGTIIS